MVIVVLHYVDNGDDDDYLTTFMFTHFISGTSKFYAFINEKTSASGGLCPSDCLTGLCPWTALGNFALKALPTTNL